MTLNDFKSAYRDYFKKDFVFPDEGISYEYDSSIIKYQRLYDTYKIRAEVSSNNQLEFQNLLRSLDKFVCDKIEIHSFIFSDGCYLILVNPDTKALIHILFLEAPTLKS